MQKSIRKFFAFPLAAALIFASIICCCLSGHAEAGISHQEVQNTQASSHHSHHGTQENHSTADNCECPKLQGTLAKNFDILKAVDIVLYSFNHQIILDKIFLAYVPDSHNLFIGTSPPQLSSSITPLYIKNRTLRV